MDASNKLFLLPAAIPEEGMEIDNSGTLLEHPTAGGEEWQIPKIDDSNTNLVGEISVIKKFTKALDQLDNRVEKLRKDALNLQEKRDFLLMSIDVIKNDSLLNGLDEYETEEINCYIQRISSRLGTVNLNVNTVRDSSQEDSLHQVNVLIDTLIANTDRTVARHRCQTFLNCCSSSLNDALLETEHQIDKKFETFLLGCTLDDQKMIKKRLQALMTYFNKQTISE